MVRNLLDLCCWMVQALLGVNPLLANFEGWLESKMRARARGLEVLANAEGTLAKEKHECACSGVHPDS